MTSIYRIHYRVDANLRVEWLSAVDLSDVPFDCCVTSPFESMIVVPSLKATDFRGLRSVNAGSCRYDDLARNLVITDTSPTHCFCHDYCTDDNNKFLSWGIIGIEKSYTDDRLLICLGLSHPSLTHQRQIEVQKISPTWVLDWDPQIMLALRDPPH